MNIAALSTVVVTLLVAVAPVWAADDLSIERLATCQDSWLDWQKNDPVQMKKFADHFRSGFSQTANDPFWVPKRETSLAGLRVEQVFPDSVGMGVGFSVTVGARFDQTRRSLEKVLARSVSKCETSDDMRSCELEIGDKRTFVLMAEDNPKSTTTLLGCYYYYEK